eukprot:scaffold9811_cov147-Skeletonema_marinoi.AAC.1
MSSSVSSTALTSRLRRVREATGLLLYANYEGTTEEGKERDLHHVWGEYSVDQECFAFSNIVRMIELNNCTVNPAGGEVQRVMYILHKFSCPGEENKMNR